MRIELKGTTFTVVGGFRELTKAQVQQQLLDAGAKITKNLAQRTEVMIVGWSGDAKQARRAKARGLPIIEEAELFKLLKNGDLTIEESAEELPEEIECMDVDGAIQELRELLSKGCKYYWQEICDCLDKAESSSLPLLADYVASHVCSLVNEELVKNCSPSAVERYRARPFEAPFDWVQDMLQGKDSPKFRVILTLNLGSLHMTRKIASKVLECHSLSNVVVLNLSGNRLSGAFFKDLAQAEQFSKVEKLLLSGHALSAKAASHLSNSRSFSQLKHLRFLSVDMSKGNALGNLFANNAFSELESLRLDACGLKPKDWNDFAEAIHLTQLKQLDIGDRSYVERNQFDEESLRTLLTAPHLSQLEELGLSDSFIAPWLGETLRYATNLSNLKRLRLCRSSVDSTLLDAITECSHLDGLEELMVGSTKIPQESWLRYLSSPNASQLRHIKLWERNLDDDFAKTLARSSHLQELRIVEAPKAKITDSGVQAMAKAPHLADLERLWVDVRSVSDNGLQVIRESPYWSGEFKESLCKSVLDRRKLFS